MTYVIQEHLGKRLWSYLSTENVSFKTRRAIKNIKRRYQPIWTKNHLDEIDRKQDKN